MARSRRIWRSPDRSIADDPSFVGEPAALVEYLRRYAELGIDLFQMVFPKFPATDDMELFAREVLPAFK